VFTCDEVGVQCIAESFDVIFMSESVKDELGAVSIKLSLIAGYISFN